MLHLILPLILNALSMFDHIGIQVANFAASKTFYTQVLATLGYKPLSGKDGMYFGFGADKPEFWIAQSREGHECSRNTHIAFHCKRRALVDAFYTAAIAAGAKNNGEPGLRPEYHENYYAAFVLDLDGNNIEVVCHDSTPNPTPAA